MMIYFQRVYFLIYLRQSMKSKIDIGDAQHRRQNFYYIQMFIEDFIENINCPNG